MDTTVCEAVQNTGQPVLCSAPMSHWNKVPIPKDLFLCYPLDYVVIKNPLGQLNICVCSLYIKGKQDLRWGIWSVTWNWTEMRDVLLLIIQDTVLSFKAWSCLRGKIFSFNGLVVMKLSSKWESWCIGFLSLRWVESCESQWPAECTNHKHCCWATVWQRSVILWSEGSLVMYFTSGSISVGKVLDHAPRAAYPISIKYMSSLKGKTGTQNSLLLRKFFLLVYR